MSKMTLHETLNKFSIILEKAEGEDKEVLENLNSICKLMYHQLRHLATRSDLGYWYQEIATQTINGLDAAKETLEGKQDGKR